MKPARQGGFTLIEMIISVAILTVILAIVLSVAGVVGKNLSIGRRQGELRERVQLASARVASFLRPASLESLRVDVAGVWVVPVESTAYGGIQFQTLTGYPYGASRMLGPVRVLRFQRDSNEAANGLDDDEDGLIDEGGLCLDDAGTTVVLTEAVELFRVSRTGRTLVFTIQCSGRNSEGGMQRSRFDQTIILRNN